MDSIARIRSHQHSLPLSLHRRLYFSKPISSLPVKPLSNPTVLTPLRASSAPLPQTPHSQLQNPFSSLLKTTCLALAAAALFLGRFAAPVVAAQVSPPAAESSTETPDTDEQKERTLEEYVDLHPDDVRGLKALMEVKINLRKFDQAIDIIDRLIKIEPSNTEWPLFKSHLQSYNGDTESAKLGFEEILSRDPLSVEAYHGLVMVGSQAGLGELDAVTKRIERAMEECKKERKRDVLRDLKLLVAQVRVIEGKYTDALKVYQELVKEEPRDFRPYLCQGIIYTLLRRKDEAEKQFQKYRRLVPKGHPYSRYFDDNMIATKLFAQKVENERMGSRS